MIFCVKSQQSILFSLLKIWPGPRKDFVAEAGSPIPQAVWAHSDWDIFHLCLYKPACAHVSTASNHGPPIRISCRCIQFMVTHSKYRNSISNQQEIWDGHNIILILQCLCWQGSDLKGEELQVEWSCCMRAAGLLAFWQHTTAHQELLGALMCLLLLTSFHLHIFAFLVLFLCTPLLDLLQRCHSSFICMNWWGQAQNSCLAVKGKLCSRAVNTRLLRVNIQATELFYQVYLIFWAVKRVEKWKKFVGNSCHFRD